MSDYEYPTLKQIYLFLIEIKGFEKFTNYTQCVKFFELINESKHAEFKVDSNKILGKFGKIKLVNIESAPLFLDREIFLKWVHDIVHKE